MDSHLDAFIHYVALCISLWVIDIKAGKLKQSINYNYVGKIINIDFIILNKLNKVLGKVLLKL